MDKNKIARIILAVWSLAAIVVAFIVQKKLVCFICGSMFGSCMTTLLLSWVGQRQANKAINIIEKKIKDHH